MKKVILILGTFFVTFCCEGQGFSCDDFQYGKFIIDDSIGGFEIRTLVIRRDSIQVEKILYCSKELDKKDLDSIYFFIKWNNKNCSYRLIPDTNKNRDTLLSYVAQNGGVLVDISSKRNKCIKYKVHIPQKKSDDFVFNSHMCKLEEKKEKTIQHYNDY